MGVNTVCKKKTLQVESRLVEYMCLQTWISCTSSDEPFSTLKRPALCMAPSASLEISCERQTDKEWYGLKLDS